MPVTDRLARLIVALVLGGLAAMPVLAADDYLSALEAEADDTGSRGVSDTEAAPAAAVPRVQSVSDRQVIQEGLDFEAFEAELDGNYSGTWFLYVKLSARQRKAVYDVYRKDNSAAAVREEVVRQLASG
jgi:hypothetical protein